MNVQVAGCAPQQRWYIDLSSYSTNQMQGISLMRLSLATNAFIADNERVYRWRETRLVIEKYTISDVYERV